MYKGFDRSGQITVFIILGLLILFSFLALLMLTNFLQKEKLQSAQEDVITNVFEKEALRIFVEDCLTDSLKDGLTLLGKQGRIWSDQGGTRTFSEGVFGISYNDGQERNRVYYGITRDLKKYLPAPNAYPCNDKLKDSPFCQYQYPNTQLGFGKLALRSSTIQNDLESYLLKGTNECVTNFVKENISENVLVNSKDVNMIVSMQDEGIDVRVDYPLTLEIGNEEFSHLSQFDFFYETSFKQLLDAAVLFPLQFDWKYVDFEYTNETLAKPFFEYGNELSFRDCKAKDGYFECQQSTQDDTIKSLGVKTKVISLATGDDIFTFESAKGDKYQIARQNRPPALDYIERNSCSQGGYDYLVVKGDKDKGNLVFNAKAIDPDEDELTYSFDGAAFSKDTSFTIDGDLLPEGNRTIKVATKDSHGLEDWQDVNVLVDRPLDMSLWVELPYSLENNGKIVPYNSLFTKEKRVFFVSKEDPSFVNVEYPKASLAQKSDTNILLKYEHQERTDNREFVLPRDVLLKDRKDCFSLPWLFSSKSKRCDPDDYQSEKLLANWIFELQDVKNPLARFSIFSQETNTGKLTLTTTTRYCAENDVTASQNDVASIVVKGCIPHKNAKRPYAYPFHKTSFAVKDGKTDFSKPLGESVINPLLATHSCCLGNAQNPDSWKVAPAGTECYVNPEPGCFGRVNGYTLNIDNDLKSREKDFFKGYVKEKQVATCDGRRGNVCTGGREYQLFDNQLVCGNSALLGCVDINSACSDKPAFSYVKDQGWCSGTMGCQKLCTKPLALKKGPKRDISDVELNKLAKDNKYTDESKLPIQCGCPAQGSGLACDKNFDGVFEGTCQDGVCI